MIRRDSSAVSADPGRWVLISQIDHAHLAWQLAEHWGAGDYAPLEPRDELLWAVEHHDDGWRHWEQAPDVDAVSGRPRSFTEMDSADSVRIWSASIEAAESAGPLAAYVIAGHFCALARRGTSLPAGELGRFVSHFEGAMPGWLNAWRAESPDNTPQMAQRALRQLQFFDRLSLWFCCSEPTAPDRLATPDGPELKLAPLAPDRLRLSPWPFWVEQWVVEVGGRAVPAQPYRSREELAAAPSESVLLRWQLQPN